jgi:hypothetical protein
MSEYLVIEWWRDEIRGLEASVAGSRVSIRRQFQFQRPDDVDLSDPASAGAWLGTQLLEARVQARQALVVLPSEDVVLKLLQLPPAAGETLPNAVRYQAGMHSAVPLDQLVVDYIPLREAESESGHQVLMASVPATLVQQIQSLAETSKLEVVSIGLASLAICEVVARTAVDRSRRDEASLLVHLADGRLEVLLHHGSFVLLSHVAHVASDDAGPVLAQVHRALIAHESQNGGHRFVRGCLIADVDNPNTLCSALATQFNCKIEPLSLPKELSAAAGLLGSYGALLQQSEEASRTIDFVNPRRPIAKREHTKLYAGIVAAAVVAMLVCVYAASRLYLQTLNEQIAEKQAHVQKLEAALEQGRPTMELSDVVATWEDRRLDWLAEMNRMAAAMPNQPEPTQHRIYLDVWRLDTTPGDLRGTVQADGFARDRRDVEILNQRLDDQDGLRIRPNAIPESKSGDEYPVPFQIDIDLVAPSA